MWHYNRSCCKNHQIFSHGDFCNSAPKTTKKTSNGEEAGDKDIVRLSPLIHGHINMLGHYTFTLPEDILKGEMRTLNFNLNNELST